MRLNFKIIFSIIGLLLVFESGFMLTCIPVDLYYGESAWLPFLISAGITLNTGSLLWYFNRGEKNQPISSKDGYLIVFLGWLIMTLFGTLPYLFSGAITNFTDAFFETVSGFTTTGASVLKDIEALPHAVLIWRSLTQWIGGMGIIVLAVAILPILGIGGMQLFIAESPGISPDRIRPRISDTAKRLWYIYVSLTVLEVVFLSFSQMGFFDAVNHSLTTMATGGFSTKQASIAHWDSMYIEYVIVGFMFLAGTNFSVTYLILIGKWKQVLQNDEFKFYTRFLLVLITLVPLLIYLQTDYGLEKAIRSGVFSVVSVITTTGFVTEDYSQWSPILTLLFFIFLFYGASAGSTSGGIKIIRHVVIFKDTFLAFKRQLHPRAVIPVKLNKKVVMPEMIAKITVFVIVYIVVFAFGSILMATMGSDFMTATSAAATSLGNVGPGFGAVGPANNFASLPVANKWICGILMLLGRLELFTVLLIFTPYFWKQ